MARNISLRDGDHHYAAEVADDGSVRVDGGDPVAATIGTGGTVRIGRAPVRTAYVAATGDARWVCLDGEVYRFEVDTQGRLRRRGAHRGSLSAPMPATVIRVLVKPGDTVKRGDTLIVLEAMKMELPVRANGNGVITGVRCREGELVQPGASLIEIDESEP